MECSSCGARNRDGAKFCNHCGSTLFSDERLRQLDLCFVMDGTGSMRDHIEAARKDLQGFARKLTTHPLRPNMSYALVVYRDHSDSDKNIVSERSPFSLFLADLQLALDNTHTKGGGGDSAEAVADGLYDACYRLKWREHAHKVIMLAGDAPPHGKGGHRDKYPQGCPCGHDPETIAREARMRGITVFSLGIGDNPSMIQSFRQIARQGGGTFVSIGSADSLIEQVLALIMAEFGKVDVDGTVLAAYSSTSTPQSIAAATGLPIGEVDESMNRLRQKRLI
ncbi:MAG TPA: VWA domain-containing protein [Ktedonobacteraceae bacterium]|nr:VWA domain-containing protein [Ktedonobacteraceae bacterium]